MKKEKEKFEREQKRLEEIEKKFRAMQMEKEERHKKFKEAQRVFRTKKLIIIGGHFEKIYGEFETPEQAVELMEKIYHQTSMHFEDEEGESYE